MSDSNTEGCVVGLDAHPKTCSAAGRFGQDAGRLVELSPARAAAASRQHVDMVTLRFILSSQNGPAQPLPARLKPDGSRPSGRIINSG